MNPLRSVGARLSLALRRRRARRARDRLRVVVPSLERRLVDGAARPSWRTARPRRRAGCRGECSVSRATRSTRRSPRADARVVVYTSPPALGTIAPRFDSSDHGSSRDVERRSGRLRRRRPGSAARTVVRRRQRLRRGGRGRLERADRPPVSAPLRDDARDVALVQRRVLWRASARSRSLLARSGTRSRSSSPAASGGSSGRRADRGRRASTSRSWIDGADELGELARAFDRMRLRLARSSAPGASSSPTRRTSCARRSSRSGLHRAADDEELDEATRPSSSRRCASRSSGSRSSPRTCST